ncbi:LacI family DNA-binding transcriptional regulator [Algibacter miyuki]|uniref:LacI family DNA-binding transcriptional regulator n=1 Tax=Algibacter miyuki TaxID=1306933 RepID=A0ABV5H4U1_9FLAO|nr:LacI family DNA-binding transcriptional regulator [Algibacter miyuki]MDN3665826.1 LacI family DNA-binding transcriptional regulator [Algibacter miyuki]
MNIKPTIHDIAKALGIDSSTVSRALNDSPRVTPVTKAKILAKAKELGYQRNMLASNLRKNETHTIGVVVPRISRHFFSSAIQGIEESAYLAGYNVIICQSLEQLEREKKIVSGLVANRVDGLLISVSMETLNYDHLEILKKSGIPVIFFDRHCAIEGVSSVLIDDFKGGFDATNHLISKGCKHIVHFSGPQALEIYKNRFEGYKAALLENNIPFNEEYVISSRLMEQDGYISMQKLLAKNLPIDAVFSANDLSAIGAMKHLKEQKISIPDDIAIVGFSNEPVSSVIEPSLTTIDQSGFEIGKVATELMLEHIKNKKTPKKGQTILIETHLIERNSSKILN